MSNTIIYRHWQPGDDDAVLAFLPNTNEDWYRHKFDDLDADEILEPEGIRLAFVGKRVVGHATGEATSLFVEEKIQKFGTVSAVFVALDMRRQGIATGLMRDLHTYFKKRGYCGSILDTGTEEARKLYLKIGYRQVTRELEAKIQPKRDASQLRWRCANTEDLRTLHQLDKEWAKQTFPVRWMPEVPNVDRFNINDYRVLCHGQHIIGYTGWSQPSAFFPHEVINDPIVPNESPMEVVESLQAAIATPLIWDTCEGSRYEKPLRSLGYSLNPTPRVTMVIFFGSEIDLTKYWRSS